MTALLAMKIDTIVTDMDDTLFNEEGRISDYTLDVVKECLNRNIRFIPASGRAQPSMEPYMKLLKTGMPYIACNGAQLVNADHSLMEGLAMSAELTRQICGFWLENRCHTQVYHGSCFYYAKECRHSEGYKRSSGMMGIEVGDLVSFVTFDTPKLLGIGEPRLIAELFERSKKEFGDAAIFSISKPTYLEVAPKGGTKGDALRRLGARIGINPQNTLVFGDSLNDLSMLGFSENSVAVGNARDEVKHAARYTCLPNGQDGPARFVREHVFGRIPKEKK
ncbi:MAG: Cof-type HAD-IIB family hydrolase [Clostridia bacterium]|nr:Cof-type HAD-IIB family hydrolase [Clostridia bacterium]